MANQISLKARTRASLGKNAVKKIRGDGYIPGVIYGRKTKPLSIELTLKDLQAALRKASSENILVDLQLDNNGQAESRFALVQEIQHDHFRDKFLHVDFHEIAQDETIHLEVAVEASGESVGVKASGGLLEHTLRMIHIECLPKDIPGTILIDVSHLDLGQSIHVSDIVAPQGVTITSQPELTVFACVAPKVEEVVVTPEASKEVEVIKEKKAPEGEAAKDGAKK